MGLISKIFPRLSRELGNETAFHVIQIITEECGGFHEYVETTSAGDNQTRDRQIRAEFDGKNRKSLASKFGLSERRIIQILEIRR